MLFPDVFSTDLQRQTAQCRVRNQVGFTVVSSCLGHNINHNPSYFNCFNSWNQQIISLFSVDLYPLPGTGHGHLSITPSMWVSTNYWLVHKFNIIKSLLTNHEKFTSDASANGYNIALNLTNLYWIRITADSESWPSQSGPWIHSRSVRSFTNSPWFA